MQHCDDPARVAGGTASRDTLCLKAGGFFNSIVPPLTMLLLAGVKSFPPSAPPPINREASPDKSLGLPKNPVAYDLQMPGQEF